MERADEMTIDEIQKILDERPEIMDVLKIAQELDPDDLADVAEYAASLAHISRDDKKREAVERMKLIGIYPETIKQFENDNLISESVPPYGACYWIDEKTQQLVNDFEEKYNALVYHVIHTPTTDGEMLAFLYVCDTRCEWETDRDDIQQGRIFAQVQNLTAPELSEMGTIGYKLGPAGGLLRIW